MVDKNMSRMFLFFTLFISTIPSWATLDRVNTSPIIPVSNRPWLERTEKQDIWEGIYSQGGEGFNEEGFRTFFDLNNDDSRIYGFGFMTRREFPYEPRYFLYKSNISFIDTPLGDLSFLYAQYQRAKERKAYVLALQFNEKMIATQTEEFRVIFRPVFADSTGITEDDTVKRATQFLALIAGDLKYQLFRASAFATFSNFSTQEEPLNIQTELIDLTNVDGLQNTTALARYMVGGHIGYRLFTKWWINATYAELWTSRGSHTGTVYPTVTYHMNKYLSLSGAFQRVTGSDIFGTRDYGLVTLVFGKQNQ